MSQFPHDPTGQMPPPPSPSPSPGTPPKKDNKTLKVVLITLGFMLG